MNLAYYKKFLLVLTVSVSILFSGLTPLGPVLKASDSGPQQVSEDFIKSIVELDKKFSDPSLKTHKLDVFKLLDQTVHNSDQDEIDKVVANVISEEYKNLNDEITAFFKGEFQYIESKVEIVDNQRIETPLNQEFREFLSKLPNSYFDDVKVIVTEAREAGLAETDIDEKIIDYLKENKSYIQIIKNHPEYDDVDDMVDKDIKHKRYFRKNLKVEVKVSEDFESVLHESNEANLRFIHESKDEIELKVFKPGTKNVFVITDKKGNPLHSFHRPVQAVSFYGPYLVFIEDGSFNPTTGQMDINFINLDYFRGDIGNSNLPVFKLPLKTDKELESLKIADGALYVNDLPLEKRAFDFLSELHQVQYNIAVSMVDPETYSRSENLIKEIVYYFKKSLDNQEESFKHNLEKALGGSEELQKIMKQSVLNLQNHSEAIQQYPSKDKLAQINTNDLDELQKQALKKAEQFTYMNQDLLKTNANIQASRKFLARVHMWIANLTTPKPFGARKLIAAMASLASSSLHFNKEGIKTAYQNVKGHRLYKYLKWGGIAMGAAAIGPYLPEPFTFHLHQSLDLVQTIFSDFHSYLKHSNYGLAYFDLLGEAIKTAAGGIPNVPHAYFAEDKLPKFLMGVSSVITIPFIVFGVPHTIVNSFKALISVKRNWSSIKKEGQGSLKTFKEAFIKYVNDEKQAYDKLMSEAETKQTGVKSDLTAQEEEVLREHLSGLKTGRGTDKPSFTKRTISFAGKVFKSPFTFINWSRKHVGGSLTSAGKYINDKSEKVSIIGKYLERIGRFISPTEGIDSKEITTFGKAFQNFFFSYPSLTNTYRFLATMWNYFFLARSFALRPKTWVMAVVYPRYFRVTISGQNQRINFPSEFNGGTRTFFKHWSMRAREWFGNKDLLKLREWEKIILPVESVVYELSLQKSLEALIKNIKDPEQLKKFFDSGAPNPNGIPTSGIGSLGDFKVNDLKGEDKAFFRAYFTRLYDKTMEEYLKDFIQLRAASLDNDLLNIENMSLDELKELSRKYNDVVSEKDIQRVEKEFLQKAKTSEIDLNQINQEDVVNSLKDHLKTSLKDHFTNVQNKIKDIDQMNVDELKMLSTNWISDIQALNKSSEETADQTASREQSLVRLTDDIKATMNRVVKTYKIRGWAKKVATDLKFAFTKKELNFRHNIFKTIQPRNPQINRFLTAEKKLQDAKALARAVRSEVASLLVNKPLSLIGILALYAGVEEGILRPLHDVMNGPDSWIYMSRYLFYNGFVMGTIISIMADTWMKVQTDARIDDLGSFGKLPLQKYKDKGFWRYYFKNLFNPTNKFVSNQWHYTKLIWANIPAAFITISVTNFLMLGRFDLGSFMAGYVIVFLTPLYGMSLKFEQAFELASSWVASKVPKRFRSHPEAQSWINMEIQKKKLQFNVFYQTYEILLGSVMGIYELMSTETYGKRSFLRIIFGGYTPTELAALGLRKVGDIFGFIPGVELLTSKCEDLLTNNYTDWQKVSPRGK